ncbi:MAG: hypothetical protein FJ167_03780 [Gammaproteobacteria bacterium]|nr:hypothetical protein [Gammaproteobacteria bacterium]
MHYEVFPTRIESAFRALAYTHAVEAGSVTITPTGPHTTRHRPLTRSETALRNCATEVIRNFITGEIRVPRARRSHHADITGLAAANRHTLSRNLGDKSSRKRPAA